MTEMINMDSKKCVIIRKTMNKTVFLSKIRKNAPNQLIKIYCISLLDKTIMTKYMSYSFLCHPHILLSLNKINFTELIVTRDYLTPWKLFNQYYQADKISIIADICQSIRYLHFNQVVHGNISINNIMINEKTGNIYLVDPFQFLLLSNETDLHNYDSLCNLSPEIIKSNCLNQKSMESEIWSLGCTIFEILTEIPPFCQIDILSLSKNIIKCNYKCHNSKSLYYSEINDLLKKIFQLKPDLRPNINEICKILDKTKKIPYSSNDKSIIINSDLSKICITHFPSFPSYPVCTNKCRFVSSIQHLSSELKYYNSLVELKLLNCINDYTLKFISSIFMYITTLQILSLEYEIERDADKDINYIYGNQLSSESITCFSRNLHYLNNSIDDNSASIIFKSLSVITSLKKLELKANFIGSKSLSSFCQVVSCLVNLEYLDLSNTDITATEMTILSFILMQLKSLKYLNLTDSLIGNNYDILFKSFIYCSNLECLKLKNCYLNQISLQLLSDFLIYLPKLETLSLEWNFYNEDSFLYLISHFTCITNLKSFNFMANPINSECYKLFGENMKFITKLEKLKLAGTEIGNKGLKYIIDHIKCTTNIQYLNLNYNFINDDGLILLSNSFSFITNLKVLLLRNNSFSPKSYQIFSTNLKYITKLERLNLAGTMTIGGEEMKELSKNLNYISNIKHLNLLDNHLGKIGVKILCKAATKLKNLETLNLENNQISKDCRNDLIEFVIKLKILKQLNLSKNPINSISLEGINQLQIIQFENNGNTKTINTFLSDIYSISNHKNLTHLNISGNKIPSPNNGNLLIQNMSQYFENLKTIGFTRNNIYFLFNLHNFHNLRNLQKLNLENVNINNEGLLVEFGNILHFIPHLQYLNLAKNSLKDSEFAIILPSIKYISNLEELSLRKNKITLNGLIKFANYFSDIKNLNTLDLSENPLSTCKRYHITNIVAHFSYITRLKDLNISKCGLQDKEQMDLLSSYLYYLNRLTILRISNNNFTKLIEENDKSNNDLSKMKRRNIFYENIALLSMLHTLDLNDVGCNDKTLITFSHNFSRLNYLNELSLSNNINITSIGIKEMSNYISHLSLLTFISLSNNNNIKDEGIICLSEQLSSVSSLIRIYIDNIGMSSKGMKSFSESFKFLPHLNTLYIQENPIDNLGLIDFSHNCQYIQNLENLYCYNNNYNGYAIIEFSKFISNLFNLKVLNISGNNISHGIESFSEQLKHIPNLKELDLSSDSITNSGIISLCNHLSVLKYLNKLNLDNNNYDISLDVYKNIKITHPNIKIKRN